MVYIPILFELEDYLFESSDILDGFCIVNFIVAIFLMFYLLRHPLKYGRFYKPGTSKSEVSDRVATFAINFIPLIIYCSYNQIYVGYSLTILPSIIFIFIHLYRCTIYAFKVRSKHSAPWPLKTVIFMCLYKFFFTLLASHLYLTEGYDIGFTPVYIGKIAIFFIIIALQIVCDTQLAKLRFSGERGYRVPSGRPFRFVSSPSYMLEIILWIAWTSLFNLSFCSFAIWAWLLPMLFSRAEITHRWYNKFFSGSYPKKRTSLIPFVDISNAVKTVIGTMGYGW